MDAFNFEDLTGDPVHDAPIIHAIQANLDDCWNKTYKDFSKWSGRNWPTLNDLTRNRTVTKTCPCCGHVTTETLPPLVEI